MYTDRIAMGISMIAIHFTSYRKPSQKLGANELADTLEGMKSTAVAIRKMVKITRYINDIFTIHCIVSGSDRGMRVLIIIM